MKRFLLCVSLLVGIGSSIAAETPMWLRDVKISPDGSQIAFAYKGDIYSVPVGGGTAMRLTATSSYESSPIWSPDGSKVAFASDRNGGKDIYVMSAEGGVPTRLTYHSAAETPEVFSPDGQYVLFSAAIQDPASSALFPSRVLTELYKVPVSGEGRFTQVLATPALNLSYLPDGKSFLYEDVKGMENRWRKHHTSSVTSDIWLYDATTGQHVNLTDRYGEDRNPVLSPDGSVVYLLSERNGGSFNVYSFPLSNPTAVTQVTDFKRHPVRFLSQSVDGTLAFTYDGEIYIKHLGEVPAKVSVDVTAVDDGRTVKDISISNVREADVSPSGRQVAFVSRGEVFVTSTEHSSTKQITHTPEAESDVAWGQNDRELYYTSERDGVYNIYKATIARADDPNFSNATIVDETPMFPVDGHDRTMPSLSPDGNKLAFILDRNKLMVMDLDTHKVSQLTDGSTNARRTKGFLARWSPDSRWIAIEYNELSHDPYSDVAVVEVATGKLTKITATGYFDADPRWVLDGKALLFISERYGMRNHASWGSQYDVMLAFLTEDAYDKYRLSEEDYSLLKEVEKARKKKPEKKESDDGKSKKKKNKSTDKISADSVAVLKFDLDDVEERTVRLTPNSADISDAILSKDGETLYYLAAFEGGYDLWKHSLRKDKTEIVKKLDGAGMGMVMDTDGNIYLVGSSVKKFDTKSEKITPVKISTTLRIDPAKEREYMLRYVYNEEKARFYRTDMHGVDWDGLYADYAKFLPHINNNYDFAVMLSELLGELNVSHTGARYYGPSTKDPVASLGLLYDLTYPGPGLKVVEILKGGPFDNADSQLLPGALITAVNGIELSGYGSDPFSSLVKAAGKKTLVSFTNPGGKKEQEVVLPVPESRMSDLLYDRWVRKREAEVDSLSGGRLGYVHLESMDDASYRKIYARMLGKYVNREGIIVDTRWNGGGRLHEDIEVLLSGKTYLTQEVHGTETSVMPSRRWNKPSIMLVCEANYSNAHGTPWVYRHLGLGKLVGMPVPGTMTSVNWVTLQDSSMIFGIPVVGFRTAEGNYLENTQLEPDVRVANDPATVVAGEDKQLKTAVLTLLNDIDSKK